MAMWLDLARVEERLETRYVGRDLVYLTRTGSTQDAARAEAAAGAPEGTAVLAETQTGGRGRLGRSWVSPPGKNIHLTLIMRPPADRLRSLTIVSPLAVAEAVEQVAGLACGLKWPNDVVVGGRKLAGMIVETESAGDEVRHALVGIGVNVNLDVEGEPEIAEIATSVRRELGRDVSREDVLAALLNAFERRYAQALEGVAPFRAWRERLLTLGERVRATLGDRVEEGVAEDVDADGNLLVRRADGSLAVVEAGDVTLRSAP